jgi:decaprenyl-phosphate phosphoribosyltransferase
MDSPTKQSPPPPPAFGVPNPDSSGSGSPCGEAEQWPDVPHASSGTPPLGLSLLRLARPRQWAKSAFVVVGPLYALADGHEVRWLGVLGAVLAFGFASSAAYVLNDIRDRDADRAHPRKRSRPIASGAVGTRTALIFALGLFLAAAVFVAVAWDAAAGMGSWGPGWLGPLVGAYLVNTTVYSLLLKRLIILDVISLAAGFVLRVLGGCAAAGVEPSSWLVNCTFFVAMFLAFGKRLGERRTMGDLVAEARGVQSAYTDSLLRMMVVVTAVVSLVTYAGYVQERAGQYTVGFNLLWLTMLPATYGLLRCIVLLERGAYDDPTELAAGDRPFQAAIGLFALITGVLMVLLRIRDGIWT